MNAAYCEQLGKSYIAIAIAKLSEQLKSPKLRIQTKPFRAVFAEAAFRVGKFVLVPGTMKISAVEQQAQRDLVCTITPHVSPKTFVLLPHFGDTFASPAWAIRASEQEDKHNMAVQFKNVNVNVASGKQQVSIVVQVPIVVNTRALSQGDEALLFRPPQPKALAPKRGLAVSMSTNKVAKK